MLSAGRELPMTGGVPRAGHQGHNELSGLSAARPRLIFSIRSSISAHVLLHSVSGLRICSSTASCSSNEDSWAFSASMLRRCAATLPEIALSCAAERAPGSGNVLDASGGRAPNPARSCSPSVTARSWAMKSWTMPGPCRSCSARHQPSASSFLKAQCSCPSRDHSRRPAGNALCSRRTSGHAADRASSSDGWCFRRCVDAAGGLRRFGGNGPSYRRGGFS